MVFPAPPRAPRLKAAKVAAPRRAPGSPAQRTCVTAQQAVLRPLVRRAQRTMALLFKPWTNTAFRIALVAIAVALGGGVIAGPMVSVRSPLYTQQRDQIDQPVQFEPRHHGGDEGIDCRYCHALVEKGPF